MPPTGGGYIFGHDMIDGFLKLNRKFFKHPFWSEKRAFSRAEAWIDILQHTQYDEQPQQRLIKNQVIIQNYGEAIMSTRYCGRRWGWHKTKVLRYFDLLKNMEQITTMCVHNVSRIIVTNFATYNNIVSTSVSTSGPPMCPPTDHLCVQVKEVKKDKKDKNIKKDKSFFVEDSTEYQLSDFLFTKIRENNPNYKKPNLQAWSNHIDLMIRIDKRIPEQIYQVIGWCQSDEFWMANILSTKKLREKYDQLAIKMNGAGPRKYSKITERNVNTLKNWEPPEDRTDGRHNQV